MSPKRSFTGREKKVREDLNITTSERREEERKRKALLKAPDEKAANIFFQREVQEGKEKEKEGK